MSYNDACSQLSFGGKVRIEYVNLLEEKGEIIRKEGMHITWVTDFPLFEEGNEAGVLQTVHHPFTSPHPEDIHLLETSPLSVCIKLFF